MVNFTAGSVLTASALNTAFNTQTIDAQTGTTFTFGTANSGELVTLSNASGGTATIPPNSTYGAATGTVIGVMNAGTAGSFVIAAGSGVTLNAVSGSTTLAPLEAATLVKLATNTWQLTKGGGIPKASYSATTGSPTVTTVSGKTCVQFTGSGSITISTAGLVEVLVVGGGGGGGGGPTNNAGPGGGAGGHITVSNLYLPAETVTITVGAGGAATLQGNPSAVGQRFIGLGGGGGLSGARNGGSGAGAGAGSATTGTAQLSQGNNGGTRDADNTGQGGGGGAGAVGSNGTAVAGGGGGNGTASSITGSSVTRGGGGGGAYASGSGGAGGTGGGGAGHNTAPGSGTVNTGGGGGGVYSGTAGSGGSGIVILLFG